MHGLYRIKVMLREWQTLFWSLAFPIFLGTVFYFMFSGISELSMFKEISIGVIVNEEKGEFLELAKGIEMSNDSKMFVVNEFETTQDALKELEEGNIRGIIDLNNNYELTVRDSKTDISLIKTFVDQYVQNEKLIKDTMEKNPELIPALIESMSNDTSRKIGIKDIELKGQDKDCYSQYFFAVIAMTCLIAANMGVSLTKHIQADMTTIGARRNVSPTSKVKQIAEDFIASFILYDIMTVIVLLYLVFVLKRDFGTNFPLVMLATFVGNFNGMAAGTLIGVFVKGTEKKKDGMCVLYFMGSSFFAGLQWADITFLLEKKCPIVNRINPGTLIVNSFKSLAVFGDVNKYITNVVTLFAIGLLFLALSVIRLRRTKYASI